MNPKLIPRRTFFRGTTLGAGGVFFAPFLRQLEAATNSSVANPARILFFVQGNGMYPDQIQPEGIERHPEPGTLEDRPLAGHPFANSVAPLEPFADRMALIHGLSGRVALGNHGCGMGALGCFPSPKDAFAETIDAAMAKALPGIFFHSGLGVVTNPETSIIYNVSARSKGVPLPTQCSPLGAHKSLFSISGGAAERQKFNANTQLLDFLAEDVKRMQQRLDGAEKQKLDHYLHAFESMSGRQGSLVKLQERISMVTPEVTERYGANAFAFERMEAQFEVAAGAFIAGLTNVITLSSGAGRNQVGVSFDGSELDLAAGPIPAHEVGHQKTIQETTAAELHIRTRRRHCEKLATFVRKLESIPEGEGTMMDNTLIIYLSDAADQHHAKGYEWPIIVIGDLGGRLKTANRYLRYPWHGQKGHRTVANFYTTLLHAVGDRRDRFGMPDLTIQDIDQEGPLTELLT
ncbi:MAG: DUF1552 domain-containing protein [Verrucomicrobiota bacterium]